MSGILAWKIPMDRVAWWATVYGVAKSGTQLRDKAQHSMCLCIWASWWLSSKECSCNAGDAGDAVRSLGLEDLLEEGMATHSSILAWRIP